MKPMDIIENKRNISNQYSLVGNAGGVTGGSDGGVPGAPGGPGGPGDGGDGGDSVVKIYDADALLPDITIRHKPTQFVDGVI